MSTSGGGTSKIEAATNRSNKIFAIYVSVLVAGGLAAAYFTWLSWDASNQVQTAIREDADGRIAAATGQTQEAQRKLKEVEEQLRWRTVTPEQEREFVGFYAGLVIWPQPVVVAPVSGDLEAAQYAKRLQELLQAAGWKTQLDVKLASGPPHADLTLVYRTRFSNDNYPPYELSENLTKVGVALTVVMVPNYAVGKVVLFVGHKADGAGAKE